MYDNIQVGDLVYFSFVRDRQYPERIEYRKGIAICECLSGWKVDIGQKNIYFINKNNYIKHTRKN